MSCAQACRFARFTRSSWYRRSRAKDQSALRRRIRDLAHVRPRFGYLRLWGLLRREGWLVNRKQGRRLYRLEAFQLRMRGRRRKHIALHRGPAPTPVRPTEVGAWISCRIRWRMVVHFGFSPSSITGVDRVRCWRQGVGCRENWWARTWIARTARLSLAAWRAARLHSSGQTGGKRLY
ncbi:MAG: hypothetical protein R3B95_10210 [Nitrospirales bacterium]|nr:hypothetical protein [Nitrospirales bacterium]